MDEFKNLTGEHMIPEEAREQLIRGLVSNGQYTRDGAALVVDVACHAAAEAMKTAFRITDAAPQSDQYFILALLARILGTTGAGMFEIMKREAGNG